MLLDHFKSKIFQFARDESGATIVEYGIIISILSLVIIGGANNIWDAIKNQFLSLGNTVTTG